MLFFDGVAAILSIPLITYLAYHFGGELDELLVWLHRFEHSVLLAALLGVLFFFFWIRRRRKMKEVEKFLPMEKLEIPREGDS